MEIALVVVGGLAAVWGYFKLKSRAKRRAAALNLVLAKATYMALSGEERQRVHDKAVADLNSMMGGRFSGFNGEYDQYGCYAHAMAHMGIAPVFKDHPRWY